MKKYRIAYDCLFLPSEVDKGVNYKGEKITNISIYFIYKAVNKKTGKESFFKGEELKEQHFIYSKNSSCYINNFFKCMVNLKNGYTMLLNQNLHKESLYTVSYEIGDCFKYVNDIPILILYSEFLDILKSNIDRFNNSNNKPTQSVSCYFEEIK